MKIKTILKNIKNIVDSEFECKSILLEKYYYNSYDVLFIQMPDRNLWLHKGMNWDKDDIVLITHFIDTNGFEQEGYSFSVEAEKVDITKVTDEVINNIKKDLTPKRRLELWRTHYDYDVRHGKDKVIGGYKYEIKDNKLISYENENTNQRIERILCDYFDGIA